MKKTIPTVATPLAYSPFAALGGRVSAGEAPARPQKEKVPSRAVVRYERKGRKGKEVTLVEHLGLGEDALQLWLSDAKKSLGCGGTVENTVLVLQGDQRVRVKTWLEGRGVARVSVSGG